MRSAVHVATVDDLADIKLVLEHMRERAHAEGAPANRPPISQPSGFGADPLSIEILGELTDRAKLEIARKDRAYSFGLGWDHTYLLFHSRIAQRDRTPNPNAFPLRGSDLVPHPLADHLALELGK